MRSLNFRVPGEAPTVDGWVMHARCAECGREGRERDITFAYVRVGNEAVALLCPDCIRRVVDKVLAMFPHRSLVEVDEATGYEVKP